MREEDSRLGDDRQPVQPNVANTVSEAVSGGVVQAGVVHGDVHIHEPPIRQVIPWQLPAAPMHFVGRADAMAQLDRWRSEADGRRLLVALGGPGGVGKTALSAHWLRAHASLFRDGQLYLDFGHPDSGEPISTSDALGRCLRALGVASEQIPAELDERVALFRSTTADKEVALLLDNVVSAAQVRLLAPISDRSVVISTSRVRLVGLALDGAHFLDLEPLTIDDAVRLLTEVVGYTRVEREWDDARALCQLCSGFPLAMAVLNARILAHPHWTLRDFVDQLREQHRRLASLSLIDDVSVQAVFDACYRALSTGARQLYRLLAVCPGEDFPIALVMWLYDDACEVKELLRELVEAHMLREPFRGRFRYHDLLRVHAAYVTEDAEEGDLREPPRRRVLEWYLARAIEADVTVNPHRWHWGPGYASVGPGFGSAEEALDWYEQERANLLVVVAEAQQQGFDELAWQTCEALWSFFLYRKHYPDWFRTHRSGIASARRCGDPVAESRMRCQLGFGYLDLNQFDMATEVCAPALELAESSGHQESISTALSQLAKAARGRGDLDGALGYFRRSLELVERTGNRRGIALRLRRIGNVLADLGRDDEAIEHMLRSADLLAEVGDSRGRARVLTFLGAAYARVGRTGEAVAALGEALEGMRDSGSPTYQADILYELAELADHAGEATTALRHRERAERLYQQSGHPHSEVLRAQIARLDRPDSST